MSARVPAVVCVEKGKKEITVLNWGNPSLFGFDNKGAVLLDGMHVTTYHAGFTFDGFVRVCPHTRAVEVRFAHGSETSGWCKTASAALNEVNKKMNNLAHKSVTSGRLVLGIGYALFQQRLKTVFPQLQNATRLPAASGVAVQRAGTRKRRAVEMAAPFEAEEEQPPSTPPPSLQTLHHTLSGQASLPSSSSIAPSKRPRVDSFDSFAFVCDLMQDGNQGTILGEWANEEYFKLVSPVHVERSFSGEVINKLPSPKAKCNVPEEGTPFLDEEFYRALDMDYDMFV